MASKATLLKLAGRGQLHRGPITMHPFRPTSRTNPRLALCLPGGAAVGWVPYGPEYQSAADRAILAAIDGAPARPAP
jgi:hypothetical protein